MFYYLPTHQSGLQSALLKLKREKNLYLRFNRPFPYSGLGDTRKTNIRLCSDRLDRRLVSSVGRAPVSAVQTPVGPRLRVFN